MAKERTPSWCTRVSAHVEQATAQFSRRLRRTGKGTCFGTRNGALLALSYSEHADFSSGWDLKIVLSPCIPSFQLNSSIEL